MGVNISGRSFLKLLDFSTHREPGFLIGIADPFVSADVRIAVFGLSATFVLLNFLLLLLYQRGVRLS